MSSSGAACHRAFRLDSPGGVDQLVGESETCVGARRARPDAEHTGRLRHQDGGGGEKG